MNKEKEKSRKEDSKEKEKSKEREKKEEKQEKEEIETEIEESKLDKKKKEEKKDKDIEFEEASEIPSEFEFETVPERMVPVLTRKDKEIKEEKLEDFLRDVKIEEPKEEKKVPPYLPFHEEKEEFKYTNTTEIKRFEARDSETRQRPRRFTISTGELRESKNPLLREIGEKDFQEVIKYEKLNGEEIKPTEFEPTFKHPEKKLKKYLKEMQ